MAIIEFRATSLNRAFLLNAFATAIIAVVTVAAKNALDENEIGESEALRTFLAFVAGFVSALIIYWILYFLFGFGGGMLAPRIPVKTPFQHV